MKLCQKCGSLLMPVKSGSKVEFMCRNCNKSYRVEKGDVPKFKEKISHGIQDVIPVVDKQSRMLPVTKLECPECGHGEAVWWTQQTRASDEPETRFYRCTKCGKTWREYS